MNRPLFEYSDYKSYLRDILNSGVIGKRGGRSLLASAGNCQLTFVSQVLNGQAHFSLEQGDGISRFLSHNTQEREFFLLLVQLARAGTDSLRTFFGKQIQDRLLQAKRLGSRVDPEITKTLTAERQTVYYSSWVYAAIHVLVGIHEYRTAKAIAKKLGVSLGRVSGVLKFLEECGLLCKEGNEYKPAKNRLHLGTDSLMISRHHQNWRLRAIQYAEQKDESNLQYSSVVTISESDRREIRTRLMETILELKKTIQASKDEKIYCFNLDFFELGSVD